MSVPVCTIACCTHKPNPEFLRQVLEHIRHQTIFEDLEILIINNDTESFPENISLILSSVPQLRIVQEVQPGLTKARERAVQEATAEILIFLDDDNLLSADYAEQAVNYLKAYPEVTCIGGKVIPEYLQSPPDWFAGMERYLACRDLGDKEVHVTPDDFTAERIGNITHRFPLGAGMAVRRQLLIHFFQQMSNQPTKITDRRGVQSFSCGGDVEICLWLLSNGHRLSYVPELNLRHLIPASRLKQEYLERIVEEASRTWVVLSWMYGVGSFQPLGYWGWLMRSVKLWLKRGRRRTIKARLAYAHSCGIFRGRREIAK
ncbi:MAG: glycosyltransferase [Candidatus Sumerlaeia bacterium]|nr:glycosyltransferase [Candidatus Sumerlaeia bacterium]